MLHSARFAGFLLLVTMTLSGCCDPIVEKPDYNRPLPPGQSALRKLLNPADWPDLTKAWNSRDPAILDAMDKSLSWFAIPSSQKFYPFFEFTHMRSQTSVYAMKKLLQESTSPAEFDRKVREQFDCYISVGYNDKGGVLFTGYFTPIFKGSLTRSAEFPFPLYKKPVDLVADPLTGDVKGRKVGDGFVQYPSRAEIESTGMLDGTELVFVATRLDQYVIQVNGSAKIDLVDGRVLYIGYAANNGHEYTGLGQQLLKDKIFPPERLSLPAIREYFSTHPDKLEPYIKNNKRFVFFQQYDGNTWPSGSLGVRVTPRGSIATDKTIFPRGNVTIIDTRVPPDSTGALQPLTAFMMDQDTGGAIRAAGRADIYMGIGPQAESMAGRQFAEGKLFYFFLNPRYIPEWHQRMLNEKLNRTAIQQAEEKFRSDDL